MHIAGAAGHRRPRQRGARHPRGAGRSDGVAESGIEARRRRYEGGWSPGEAGQTPRGAPASVPSASHRPTIGASRLVSRPKSGCCANGSWALGIESAITWCTCRPRRRSAPSYNWPTNAGRSSSSTRNSRTNLGLDHCEGRSLPDWRRHVVLTATAYSFLQHERGRRGPTQLTLPRVRAVIHEVLTAHFFMTHPGYLEWRLKLKDVQLRI